MAHVKWAMTLSAWRYFTNEDAMGEIAFYGQMAVTVLTAGIGLIITHWFTSQRDRKNAERLRRLDGLSKAYFSFVRSGIQKDLVKKDLDGKLLPTARDIEDAIAIIHLYGTNSQSKMANTYANQMATTRTANSTVLINSLRETIRADLSLSQLETTPAYLSIEIFPDKQKS
jgi:hypothetical protein